MADLLTLDNLVTLMMLIMLQAVLGFDNLLYISLESKRAPEKHQASVRRWGIGLAMVLRIVLLLVLMKLISYFQNPMFTLSWEGVIDGTFNLHALIVLLGGALIIYTAIREIIHMVSVEDLSKQTRDKSSVVKVVFWIVLMNLVFSFDSILSAMALTEVFAIMATAIVIGGLLMIWLADRVADFLERNRMYEVLGLFILFVVGIMLLSEGGHLAEMHLFGNPIVAMNKTTFYFVIVILVISDIVQSRYQKKLLARKSDASARESA